MARRAARWRLSERPDIILMDLEMPVVDGWEATRRLKGNPQTRDIPIIALSAHALAGEREKALAAGCDEFDTKPIEFDRLVATLRRILADRKSSEGESQCRRSRFEHDLTVRDTCRAAWKRMFPVSLSSMTMRTTDTRCN